MNQLRLTPSTASFLKISPEDALKDNRAIVFYHPDVAEIAVELCVRYPHDMRPGDVSWGQFPDGWANIKFEPGENIINRHIVFIMSAHKMNGFLEQICLLIALCRQFAKSVTIVIPYFGPATMERVSNEGELATAEPIFKLISRPIPPTCGGLPALILIDIHDIRERFYPTDNVTPKMMSAAELILPIIRRDKLTIVFPDEGAYKRFGRLAAGLPVVTFTKKRSEDSREMHLGSMYDMEGYGLRKDHDPWKRFIIWDDLVHTGGTLIECATALKQLSLSKRYTLEGCDIRAFTTHSIFENDAHLRFTDTSKSGINHFYVTNTIPEVAGKLRAHETVFTVLDIADTIAPFIMQRILPDAAATQQKLKRQGAFVYISSTSAIKRAAVDRAFKLFANVEPCIAIQSSAACPSNVPDQPWGEAQTIQGLTNRHNALRKHVFGNGNGNGNSNPDLYPRIYLISVENGLMRENDDGPIIDKAYILMERFQRGHNEYRMTRATVQCGTVPKTLEEHYMNDVNSEEDLTFGAYLVRTEKGEVPVNAEDWSQSHGGSEKSREEHIRDGVTQCLI